MLPIRDLNPTLRAPVVTWSLIAVCALVFAFELTLGTAGRQAFVDRFGVIAEVLTRGDWSLPRAEGGAQGAWITPLTSLFLHAGWSHIVGNLWFLHIFGDNVEDQLGRGRFLAFYLLTGLVASAVQVAVQPQSGLPLIGASGAISGVLGAYVLLFPHARVITLVPLILLFPMVEVPAWAFIFLWFGIQLVQGWASLGEVGSGVAWFAHLGGFVSGLGLVSLLRQRERGLAHTAED